MYGNRQKARILTEITNYLLEHDLVDAPVDYHAIRNRCKKDDIPFSRLVNWLSSEGYITVTNPRDRTADVRITHKGIAADMSNQFIRENNKYIWRGFSEVVLVSANLAVAIIAFFALRKDETEIKKEAESLKIRVIKLETIISSKK